MTEPGIEPHNEMAPPAPLQHPAPPAHFEELEHEIRTAQADLVRCREELEGARFEIRNAQEALAIERAEAEVLRAIPEGIALAIESEQPVWARDPDLHAAGVAFGFRRSAEIARRHGHSHT